MRGNNSPFHPTVEQSIVSDLESVLISSKIGNTRSALKRRHEAGSKCFTELLLKTDKSWR